MDYLRYESTTAVTAMDYVTAMCMYNVCLKGNRNVLNGVSQNAFLERYEWTLCAVPGSPVHRGDGWRDASDWSPLRSQYLTYTCKLHQR